MNKEIENGKINEHKTLNISFKQLHNYFPIFIVTVLKRDDNKFHSVILQSAAPEK